MILLNKGRKMIIKNFDIYDGSILQDRFVYDFFKTRVLRTGNIIAFRAPMKVDEKFMVDKEDLENDDFIFSDDAINFCIEIPDISLFAGVCFQRLFVSIVANILASKYLQCNIEVEGDDIIVHKEHEQGGIVQKKGKASVSIAKQVNGAVLIHLGINIKAGKKAPAYAFSTNLTDEQCEQFMREIIEMFYGLANDIFVSTCKIVK